MANNPLNPTLPPLSTQPYYPMLQESIHHFLLQLQSGVSDFTHFNSMFSRLIQTIPSPPLEIIWFYGAANFHTHINLTPKNDEFGMILALKELFQLLVSCCSPSCSSLKRVAVLAPLVFELHNFVSESKSRGGLSSDNVVIIEREVGCLVDRLVSFISLCCEGVDDHDDSLAFSPCFVDLVKVWTVPRRGSEYMFEDDFRMFFPSISDEVCEGLLVGSGVGVLAGVVMCQAFLLSLCLKFGLETPKKSEENVLSSAVDTITGFRSCYFFDILLRGLLDSRLPVSPLLTTDGEILLRGVLFDAVLVDYPFFNPRRGIHLCSLHLKTLASIWLFVADKALQFARNNGDQTRVITYTKAFSNSLITSQLVRWVSDQIGTMGNSINLNLSTPTAFLESLVQIGSQASTGFDSEFKMLLEKTMLYKPEMKQNFLDSDVKNLGLEFGVHETIEMMEETDAGCNHNSAAVDGCRKRKGGNDEGTIQAKLLKYHNHDSPIKNFPALSEVSLIRRN